MKLKVTTHAPLNLKWIQSIDPLGITVLTRTLFSPTEKTELLCLLKESRLIWVNSLPSKKKNLVSSADNIGNELKEYNSWSLSVSNR